jgi:cholesterol oxidase
VREPLYDYDWIVIGSGFGGSVAALRLAEKGYSVCVLECGRRFADEDFAKTTWQSRRYFWSPRLGMRGIFRLTLFKDIFIASGCGVGGGSLGYANTLYRARDAFFEDAQWGGVGNLEAEFAPHYDTAERMLGVTEYDQVGPADELLRELGEELGVPETFKSARVGVYLGDDGGDVGPGQSGGDPYFGGEGPERFACRRCGSCMIGCRHGAKNTLVKNYLFFAEKLGAEVCPEREASEIRPLGGAADGSAGYEVKTVHPGAWLRQRPQRLRARGVVVAAGPLGTNKLLANCKARGELPRLSNRLGHVVRTNTESIQAVQAPDDSRDFAKSIAITSSIYPDPDTHIEVVTFGKAGDSMGFLNTLMTGNGTRLTRPLLWIGQVLRHPLNFLKSLWVLNSSRRTVILLVMQTLDTAMRLRPRRKLFGRGVSLHTEQDPERPNPTYLPVAEQAARWWAKRTGGLAQSSFTEAIFNIPTTAHILGGAVIGDGPATGVVDAANRAYGYENLLICDGSAIPANPGVNPSLTITAMAEHAMAEIPAKGLPRPLPDAARPARRGPLPSGPQPQPQPQPQPL